MAEYPSQSHASREPERREVAPITTSEGRVRRAPLGRRFRETFFQGDARSVGRAMFWEVLMPGIADNVADAFHAGIDNMFHGTWQNRRPGPRGRSFSGSGISKHNPDRALRGFADSSPVDRYSDSDRSNQRVDVIALDSRVEAEEVLHQMSLLIDQFDVCTLADFYKMVRITPTGIDYKFGWEDLGSAKVVHSRGEYYIDLPRPAPIKN